MADVFLGCLVEGLFGQHGALLDVEADFEHGREGIGEVSDTERPDETREVTKVGNGSSNDEG
jgi:hypothetical protein